MQGRRAVIRWRANRWAQIQLEGASAPVDCYIKDITYRGLQVCLKHQIPHDAYLKLKLLLDEEFSLDAEVWVAWQKTIDDVRIYGLYFNRISDSDKERIYRFIHKHFPGQIKEKWWAEEKGKDGEVMKDRRLFERFSVRLPLKLLDRNSGKEYEAYTYDVCAKGVGFFVKEALTPSTALEMWVKIPDKGEPLYARGEVAWSKVIASDKCQAGVDLERADLMGISRCIRNGSSSE